MIRVQLEQRNMVVAFKVDSCELWYRKPYSRSPLDVNGIFLNITWFWHTDFPICNTCTNNHIYIINIKISATSTLFPKFCSKLSSNWQNLQEKCEEVWFGRSDRQLRSLSHWETDAHAAALCATPLLVSNCGLCHWCFFCVKNSGGTEQRLCCGVIAPSVIWLYSYIQSSTDSQHGFF